jgi:hypothetical protein
MFVSVCECLWMVVSIAIAMRLIHSLSQLSRVGKHTHTRACSHSNLISLIRSIQEPENLELRESEHAREQLEYQKMKDENAELDVLRQALHGSSIISSS